MRSWTIFGLFVFIAALVVSATPAAAQIPEGSYQQTCRNVGVSGSTLYADCQNTSGGWQRTELHDFQRCGPNHIENINGQLQCGGPGSGYDYGRGNYGQAGGSYQQTCRNISTRGSTLYAECQDTGGGWHHTELRDYQRCGTDIQNINGNLQCGQGGPGYYGRGPGDRDHDRDYDHDRDRGRGPGAYAPHGSYQQTCQNIQVSGNTLRASCQKKNGKWKSTSLNNFQYCRGDIQNDNGKLRCR